MKKQSTTPGGTPRPRASAPAKRRSRGRPRLAQGVVGSHAILVAARQLLEKQPPHEVTMALIARHAGVDPTLVRYYFADREQLLFAVVEHILADWAPRPPVDAAPAEQLAAQIANLLEFSSRVRSIQRLMEECSVAKSRVVRERIRELNSHAVQSLAKLLRTDRQGGAEPLDAMFLHVAMIGLCEFFSAAQQVIQPLAPKGMPAAELSSRYAAFIQGLVLDGVRRKLRPG
jgi:TetR/AcrR family transcriptional regulator